MYARFILTACLWLLIACADRMTRFYTDDSDGLTSASTSRGSYTGSRYMKCNIFADETFRGEVTVASDKKENYISGCFDINIFKSPENLFKENTRLLQAFPMNIKNEEEIFGKALTMKVYHKERGQDEPPSLVARAIDRQSINSRLKASSTKHFFKDYKLQICDIDPEQWKALQLVVYRDNLGKNTPIRTTKFLLPPFLSDPNEYNDREEKGLAALHPLLSQRMEATRDGDSEDSDFHQHASSLCSESS